MRSKPSKIYMKTRSFKPRKPKISAMTSSKHTNEQPEQNIVEIVYANVKQTIMMIQAPNIHEASNIETSAEVINDKDEATTDKSSQE